MPKIIKTKPIKRKNSFSKDINPVLGLLLSGLKGFIFTFIMFLLVAFNIYKGNDFTPVIMVILYFIIAVGGFISGLNAAKTVKGRGIINGLWGGLVYLCLLLILNASLLKFSVNSNILILIPVCLIGGIIGGIYNSNKK